MLKLIAPAAALVPLLLVTACENIPYYDESLNWFSWSEYDPEVDAIEDEIPPPGELEADDHTAFVRDTRGGYVYADPPPGAEVTLGATPLMNTGTAGNVSVADAQSSGASGNASTPLVGIRSSVGPSVTWRSARGTP
jgi:hypothetical protein